MMKQNKLRSALLTLVLVIAAALLCGIGVFAAEGPTFTLSGTDTVNAAGTAQDITLSVELSGNTGIAYAFLDVQCDAAWTVKEFETNLAIYGGGANADFNAPVLGLSALRAGSNFSYNGTLGTLTITVPKGTPAGDYTVTLALHEGKTGNVVAYGEDYTPAPVAVTLEPVTIHVEGAAPANCVSALRPTEQLDALTGEQKVVNLSRYFSDSEGHELHYVMLDPTQETTFTKIVGSTLYFTEPMSKTVTMPIRAICSEGHSAEMSFEFEVQKGAEGLDVQYAYDESPADMVTVYVTISSDGIPLVGKDGTILNHLEVQLPYVDLAEYDLQDFYRYHTDIIDGRHQGPYTDDEVVERPTAMHLFNLMVRKYYDEGAATVDNMFGDVAFPNNGVMLEYTGGATSTYMKQVWGHDENLMYYRNHVYPLQSPGWGSTADYILLSDGDTVDMAMFTDWNFYLHGAFARFDQDTYVLTAGDTLNFRTQKFGTRSVAEGGEDAFIPIVGLNVLLLDEHHNIVDDAEILETGEGEYSLTVTQPGTYYLLGLDPDAGTDVACIAPATAKLVVEAAKQPLTIVSQPADVECALNEVATFTVEATGEGLTYTWYYKNPTASKFTAMAASEKNSYSITMTAARNGRQMYCVVKDAEGNTVKTAVATMTIAKPAVAFEITRQPADVECALNEVATFTVEATGEGLTYTWYYKNPTASKFTAMAASEKNTYSITMTAARNGRQMYCVVKDAAGNTVKSETATMTIAKPALTITRQPQNVECLIGELATFTVEAEGEGALTYTWYYKNPTASKFTAMAASEKNTYSLSMTDARNGRQMYCVVKDAAGNSVKSEVVTMTLPKLYIKQQPQDVECALNELATFTVEAVGEGLTYTWYYKNPTASKFTAMAASEKNTYSITMTSARNGRQMYCVITDAKGNTVKTDVAAMTITK